MKSSSEYEILTSQIFNDYIIKNEENTIKIWLMSEILSTKLENKTYTSKAIKMCEYPFNWRSNINLWKYFYQDSVDTSFTNSKCKTNNSGCNDPLVS